jgi:hypothetical protein
VVVPVLLLGCGPSEAPATSSSNEPAAHVAPNVASASTGPSLPSTNACSDPVAAWDGGVRIGSICERDAAAFGYTILDLSDTWTPRIFSPHGATAPPPYRETFRRLADERLGDGPEWDRAKEDRFLDLYGIFPTLRVMAARLSDDERHACHDAVDDGPLERLERDVDPWADRDRQRAEAVRMGTLLRQLETEKKKRDADSIDALRTDPKLERAFSELERVGARPRAIAAMQAHLRCEGLMKKKKGRGVEGAFDHATTDALRAFQRKHMIVSWSLDAETRTALATDSRELDFRGMLRVLRERVVGATGLIEDGSAAGLQETVMGRSLESAAFRAPAPEILDLDAAPDLVARATDAAARALGWTSPEAARAFFRDLGPGATEALRVAVRLPPLPDYHGPQMNLRAEIDRGDVWYDFPFTKGGHPAPRPVERRPSITLYAKHAGGETALVRWPTTIGGWKAERVKPKEIVLAYKMSPPGDRLWREIFAAPVWIPPESTPKRELVRSRPDGSWATKTDLFGPSYASAYGLTMIVHHQRPRLGKRGDPDEGIRTHGSVSYSSIHHGTSHGCHRLFNHLALRLTSFLLDHRSHAVKGPDVVGYGRTIKWQGKDLKLAFDARGYRYELDPPVVVSVLPGRILGKAQAPPEPQPLPSTMEKLFKQELFEP